MYSIAASVLILQQFCLRLALELHSVTSHPASCGEPQNHTAYCQDVLWCCFWCKKKKKKKKIWYTIGSDTRERWLELWGWIWLKREQIQHDTLSECCSSPSFSLFSLLSLSFHLDCFAPFFACFLTSPYWKKQLRAAWIPCSHRLTYGLVIVEWSISMSMLVNRSLNML